ncbi:calcium-dependent lipid-binding family protein [Striga asiatica]|uniref:Calcium-dependent lipid-binding family protein n=1 Tax=Striga asiatica TaxID=4170 RepID=A0A5A7QCG5_STRAF|nr:calcium-dependent lipid-binding family protein [Striga asiatica]
MELDLQWDGNPKIVLDIKTRLGVTLPIQETIRDAIEDSITWPVRKIIPILPGDYSYLELKPVGTLNVKLIEAKELTNKDIIGKSDPFAELFVRPLRDRIKTSKTINNQTSPIWNEHFEFVVEDVTTQHLTIRVYDDEGIQASELISCAQLPLGELEAGKVKDVWLKLVKDLEIQKDQKNRGQNLPAKDILGKSDPFVVLRMKKSEQTYKTRVLNDTLNPVWNQTFDFVVEDGLHELLILDVYDHDTFGKEKMSRCIMTLTRAILEGEFTISFLIDGTDSGRLNLSIKWTRQQSVEIDRGLI